MGCSGGIPFPIPKDGNEAIWNAELRYRGDTFAQNWAQAAVTRTGDYALVKFEYEYDFQYGNCSKPASAARAEQDPELPAESPRRRRASRARSCWCTRRWTRPRSRARRGPTTPGQRRVRLAPNVAYDNPGTAADGLRTNDDFGMFNGATDRYNWKLVGKKEMYMPYNSYRMTAPNLKYSDVLKPGHLNQDLARYELHRVWVVEATLKPGTSHIYAQARVLHRRGQLGDPRDRQVRRPRRAVALLRAAQRELVQRPDVLRHDRGAQRPAVGPLHRDGPEERGEHDLPADQAHAAPTTRRTACARSARASARPGERRPGAVSRALRAGTAPFSLGSGKW